MTTDLIKEFKINNLIDEYNKYSSYLYNFQSHIDKCHSEHIISIRDRNNLLKNINDIMRLSNAKYNECIVEIDKNDISNKDLKINCELTPNNVNGMKKLIKINNLFGIKINNEFDEINENIITKLAHKIGFPNIHTALSLLIGDSYKYLFDDNINQLISFYNNVFTPIKYTIEKCKDKQIIFVKNKEFNQTVLLHNCADIYIKYENSYIVLSGYFINDSLNIIIRTSQLGNNLIYKRKKEIETFVLQSNEINEKFFKLYMKNILLADILSLNNSEILNKIQVDYEMYTKLVKSSFIHLMKEFIKDDDNVKSCIKNMFNIIRLLLFGSEENVNIAGLLYGIAKEKRINPDFSVSDIIYKNLSYLSQIKLKKSITSIKTEIDKIKASSIDDIDIKKQIAVCKNMPDYVKKAALEKVEEMKSSNNDYYKQSLYVKMLLNFPWPSSDDDAFFSQIGKSKIRSRNFLNDVVDKLNRKVYGHSDCKEKIKEILGKWISNPNSSGSAIGLSGPPGVGKTLIAKAIGNSLNLPFVQITLGGQNDGELLHGHGYTYSSAQPGIIVKKMIEAGNARCIIYFDELDKACKKNDSNEIYNILLHITDPNTNSEFQDRFFQEIKFPLNKVLFVFSYNDTSLIDPILMDRIENIEIKPFKLSDKKMITNEFILQEMINLLGFESSSVKIADDAIEYIVNQYTNEAGIRQLKRKMEKIFMKLNLDNIYDNIPTISNDNPIILTKDLVIKYLGKHNTQIRYIHNEDKIGVINGLYATDKGQGGISPIQVYENFTNSDNKFTLKLTGSQKRVMKESVMAAFTAALHCVNESIRNEYLTRHLYGFHIHAPSTSVSKNGPSAGCAFATAFVSQILQKKIRRDVAVTGEIELTGKITKIGGLQYKLTGAKKAGIRTVLVPLENKSDVEQIEIDYVGLIDDTFTVKYIDTLMEALPYLLVDFNKSYFH